MPFRSEKTGLRSADPSELMVVNNLNHDHMRFEVLTIYEILSQTKKEFT
jgi:hypothetical protein